MTTIVIAKPVVQPHWQVFGVYEGPDDRFVFGVFETDEPREAEAKARDMMERYKADHLSRT
jgi:hypothetical protein